MRIIRKTVAIGAVSLALTTPAIAQDADTVVATVNGEEITLGHMLVMRERLPEQYQNLPPDTLFDGILEQLVQQSALGAGDEDLSRRGQLIVENERRALAAGEELRRIAEAAVSDDAIQAAYDEAFANAEPSQEFNASHILVETEEEAQALIDELDDGADFAELARERSTGPSGPSGGELGWFGAGAMVPSFDEAVQAMQVGEVAGPVQTEFGWHVITLNDTRQTDAPSLDEVRDQMEAQVQEQAVQAAIEEATASADITMPEDGAFDPALLNDPSLLDQ